MSFDPAAPVAVILTSLHSTPNVVNDTLGHIISLQGQLLAKRYEREVFLLGSPKTELCL